MLDGGRPQNGEEAMVTGVSSRDETIRSLRREMPFLRRRYGVERIALYGSFAAGRPRRGSDVDLLVELYRPLGLEFVALAEYLEAVLGRKVDLSTFRSLHQSLQDPRYRPIATGIQDTLTDVQAETR
jgi:predicted nucleotidyltransferase